MSMMKNFTCQLNSTAASPRAQIIFAGAMIGLLLSKGLALVPGFSLDDYYVVNESKNPLSYLAQGRYVQAAIGAVLDNIGVSTTSISLPATILFLVAAAAAITLGILFATRNKGSAVSQAAIAAVIGSHPYLTEYFSFRESLITQGASFVLLSLIFALIMNGEKLNPKLGFSGAMTWLTIPLLILAGTQQTTFIVALFFIFSRLVMDAAASGGVSGIRHSLKDHSVLLATFLFSAVVYAALLLLSQKLAGAQHDDRAALIQVADIPSRIHDIALLLKLVFLSGEPVLSSTIKLMLLGTVAGFAMLTSLVKPQAAIAFIVLFIILAAGSIFLVSVSAIWWPVPRAIYGIGFTYGLVLLPVSVWLDKGQKFFLGMICCIVLGLIFHSNAMLYDQLRLNRWDLWTAGAIAKDLADKGVTPEQKVFLVGSLRYPAGPGTSYGDLNISALSIAWSAKYLMKEATGRDWNITTIEGTAELCSPDALWPSPASVKKVEDKMVVCMANP